MKVLNIYKLNIYQILNLMFKKQKQIQLHVFSKTNLRRSKTTVITITQFRKIIFQENEF